MTTLLGFFSGRSDRAIVRIKQEGLSQEEALHMFLGPSGGAVQLMLTLSNNEYSYYTALSSQKTKTSVEVIEPCKFTLLNNFIFFF